MGHRNACRRIDARTGVLFASMLVVLVAGGCAPAQVGVELGPSPAPPEGQAPALGPMTLEAAAVPPVRRGRLAAVAASETGVVAVGTAGIGEPLVLFSPDGLGWSRVGPVAGFELTDVAAGPGGFVAVGFSGDEAPETTAVLLVSGDGQSWRRLDAAAHDSAHASLAWVAGGPGGYRAGGYPDEGGPRSWSSAEGQVWRLDAEVVLRAAPAGGGWLELGDRRVRVVPGSAKHVPDAGVDWALLEEPAGDDTILDLRAGGAASGGMVVVGGIGKPCGLGGSCAGMSGQWTSADGVTWRLLPDGDPGRPPEHVEQLVSGPDGTLLATTYAAVLATSDGWHWATPVRSEQIGLTVTDATTFGDAIVIVGEDTRTGSPVPGIGIARP